MSSTDVYGTIAFQNLVGTFGVIRVLEASGYLASFERHMTPLLLVAVLAVALLIAAHALWIASGNPPTSSRVR